MALEEARAITDPQERQVVFEAVDKEHPPVPGCELDNGGFALTIRRS